jgi:pimeloyl-ACP methyl ester carboxylesterase
MSFPDHCDPLAGSAIQLRQGVTLQVSHCPGNAPTMVFLHGGLGNRYNWRPQFEFFRAQGQEVLTYDLAGHGQSLPYRRFSIGRHRRDLTRLLNLFKIQTPVLCCHSYGVPLGLEWAYRHPVTALVLVAGGTHDLDPWWELPLIKLMNWGGRHLYRFPSIQRLSSSLSSSHQHSTVEQFFSECPVPIERYPYEALEIFWGYNFLRRRKHDRYLEIPTLVITGGQDPVFTYSMGESLASHFRYADHLHLPNAGHVLMAEHPDAVSYAINSWLQKHVSFC